MTFMGLHQRIRFLRDGQDQILKGRITDHPRENPLFWDRIDLHIEVPLVDFRELSSDTKGGESSAVIRERVRQAREVQGHRFKGKSVITNSAMGTRLVREHCKLDAEASAYLEQAMEQLNFSARAHDRILKVARTLADLGGSGAIRTQDILEAIQYRSLDRNLFA